jgi:hypothetical protein
MVILKNKNNKDKNGNNKKGHFKKILNLITNIGNFVLKEITNDNSLDDDDDEENTNFTTEKTPIKVHWKIKNRNLTLSVS